MTRPQEFRPRDLAAGLAMILVAAWILIEFVLPRGVAGAVRGACCDPRDRVPAAGTATPSSMRRDS